MKLSQERNATPFEGTPLADQWLLTPQRRPTGWLSNALIGLSFGWWVSKHNARHAPPNRVGRDPDTG